MSSKDHIQKARTKFAEWVKKYEIYETLAADELVFSEELKPFIWTEFQNDEESFATKGFTDANLDLRMPVVGYYISRVPFSDIDDDFEVVDTELFLECPDCEGVGEDENGDDCELCLGERGTYIEFSLRPGIESNGMSWLTNDDPELARQQLLCACLAYQSDTFGVIELERLVRSFDKSSADGQSAFLAASGLKDFSSFEAEDVWLGDAHDEDGEVSEELDGEIAALNRFPAELRRLTPLLIDAGSAAHPGEEPGELTIQSFTSSFSGFSGTLTSSNADELLFRVRNIQVDSEFWMVAQTAMGSIIQSAKCEHVWGWRADSQTVGCGSCSRTTLLDFDWEDDDESNEETEAQVQPDTQDSREQLLISCLAYVSDVFGEAKLSVETRTFDQSTEEGKSAFLAASGIKNFSSFEATEVFIQSAREIEGLEEDIDQIVNLNKYPSDLLALTSHLENPEGSISGGVSYTDYWFGSSSGKLTFANAGIVKQRVDDLEVDSEFWMVAQTIMKVIVDAAKCAHIWQRQEGSGELLCGSCNRTTLVEGLEDEEDRGIPAEAESAPTPQTGFATSEPSRPDLVDAYLQATDDERKEGALNSLCAARDFTGLIHLSKLSVEHGNLPEAEYLARWAVDVAPFENVPAASGFLIESILLSQRRYHEAAWVRFAMNAYQPFEDTYEEVHLAIRRGCETSGLPDPEMGMLMERVNPFKATTDSETNETYRDYLIARFMYDYGIADERTKKAFDARAQGRYLPETLDFIDFWQMAYQFLSREVLASAVLYSAILINGGEKSPWLPGGYLNP